MRTPIAVLAAAALLTSGCGGGEDPSAAPSSHAPAPAASAQPAAQQGVLQVGQTHTYPDGVKLTVTALHVATKAQLDPTAYDKPANWKGVLVDVTLVNGSPAKLQLDFPVTVTSDPDDTAGVLASYDGPGSVTGGWWLGDAPLLPGRTKRLTAGVVVAAPTKVTLAFGSPYSAAEPREDVTVVGDAQ